MVRQEEDMIHPIVTKRMIGKRPYRRDLEAQREGKEVGPEPQKEEEGADMFGMEDENGADVSFNQRDMDRSMSRNSWKKSKRDDVSIFT